MLRRHKHPLQIDAEEAVDTLGLNARVELITDREIIEREKLVNLPVLLVNGKQVISGRNARPNEVRHILLDIKYGT